MQGNWEDSGPHQHHFHLDYVRLQDDIVIFFCFKEGLTVFKSLKALFKVNRQIRTQMWKTNTPVTQNRLPLP